MSSPGYERFLTTPRPDKAEKAEAARLAAERRTRDQRKRRIEREVFESCTQGLDRPLLRPRTGTPLHDDDSDTDTDANPHAPNGSGEPNVLPPVHFTDDELEVW